MNIYLDSIGCRLNQSEIERYARQFRAAGHSLVARPEDADMVVVNTCAVTAEAGSDSRQKIRQAARSGAGQIVVTGCWATLEPQAAAALPGVSQVVPNAVKDDLVLTVLQDLQPELQLEIFDEEFIEREPIPGARLKTRAYIKAQDGCDNHCTFCITTIARGPGRSRPIPAVLNDIQAALHGGAQEIVLTGVHLGSWGHDFARGETGLKDLVLAILADTDSPRLRLSSLEPWDLDPGFFQLWQNPRLCRHLHLPLQSGCAATLRRMARKTNPESFAGLVTAARAVVPEMAITTDVIVGFPGETEPEFDESLAFVEAMQFASGHVFSYSARPGTAAARMPRQSSGPQRKARSARMRAALEGSAAAYRRRFLGQELAVLWESALSLGPQGWKVGGLSDNYLRVTALAPRHLWNQITPVRLLALAGEEVHGEISAAQTIGGPDFLEEI